MVYSQQCVDERTPAVTHFFTGLSDKMQSLYSLSLLLTADHGKAEQCFIAAMKEYMEHDGTFIEWASLWARRVICKHAIQMIMPAPGCPDTLRWAGLDGATASTKISPFAGILSLDEFERFVFVISVLEGQSDRDCAVLLRCSDRDVQIARALAVARLAQIDRAFTSADPQA